jgi:hypothetical protein
MLKQYPRIEARIFDAGSGEAARRLEQKRIAHAPSASSSARRLA